MKAQLPLFIHTIIILLGFAGPAPAVAQGTASVSGIILDSHTGEALLMANVAVFGSNKGTSSNTLGYYSLNNLQPGTYTIVFTYIGYGRVQQDVTLKSSENFLLNIELEPDGIQLNDVVVESGRAGNDPQNLGTADVSEQLIKSVPSVLEADVFRSLQLLPGVKSSSDFTSGLYVRGGGPDQTLILLDETTIYNPSHFFGFYSIFNPDAVSDVQLYKGGYPPEFGGRIGSVLTVSNKEGNKEETGGSISLGMLASRASIEGPFKNGSWMLAVRRSTLEPVLAVLRKTVDSVPDRFYFYDVNGRFTFNASPDDKLSIALYTGTDLAAVPLLNYGNIHLNYGNQVLSTKWRKIISNELLSSLTITGSRYFNRPEFEIDGSPFRRNNEILDFSLKSDWEYLPSEYHTLSAGLWMGNINLKYRDIMAGRQTLNNRIRSHYFSAYLQENWQPSNKWALNTGIRFNAFSEGEYIRLEPRASLEYSPVSEFRLQAGYGRYYQFLTLVTNDAFSGFDLWLTTDSKTPPSYGDQFVAGVKTTPFEGYAFDMEFYYRTMKDLFELDPFVVDPGGFSYHELFRIGEGYAYGAEVLVEKQAGRFSGFIGYTFGVTRRKFPGFNGNVLDNTQQARFYPPKYDRSHDVNVVAGYELSHRWSASAIFSYATGQAYTKPLGRARFQNMPWGDHSRNVYVIGNMNASRLPAYQRLDFAFSRFGTFFGQGKAEWQFQVINAFSRKNIWFYHYNFDENPAQRNDIYLLPLIPSITYTVNF